MVKSSILLVSLAGSTFVAPQQDTFVAKGPVETISRNVGGFDELETHSAMRVFVEPGSGPISLKGPKDVFQFLRSRVENGRLILDFSRPVELHDDVVIHVHADSLKALSVSGACSVEAKSLRSHSMAIKISGASAVNVAGVHGNLEAKLSGASVLKIDGSGNKATVVAMGASTVDLRKFSTDSVSVNLTGASSVQCNTKEVSGTAHGVSSVSAPHAKNSVESDGWPGHRRH